MHAGIAAWKRIAVCAGLLILGAGTLKAQESAARPADVESVDAILRAIYDAISGPAGQVRDWNRFRSLFLPGGRLISTGRAADGSARYRVLTPEEYATGSGPFLQNTGFTEKEIARRMEAFGNIAHAFSTYESHYTEQNQARTARGINSIQLFNDGRRWWVVSIFWDAERPDNPIPAKYLGGNQ
jgi:hypothetical protein